MLSTKIIDSDIFLDMPQTSQLLYFHLSMRADDDGFVGNPKKIMRMIGSADNDLSVLFGKKFIIGFESGVIVIKHHRINNNWDKHNCKRTQYLEEFSQLNIKENGAYTLDKLQGIPVQSENSLKTVLRIEENRIEENRNISRTVAEATPKPKFQKPTIEEIKAYIKEKNYNVDANRFFNFYESKGWKVGKNPMVSWKASVATWQKDEPKTTPNRAVKEFKAEDTVLETEEERLQTLRRLKEIKNNVFKR